MGNTIVENESKMNPSRKSSYTKGTWEIPSRKKVYKDGENILSRMKSYKDGICNVPPRKKEYKGGENGPSRMKSYKDGIWEIPSRKKSNKDGRGEFLSRISDIYKDRRNG